MQEWQKMQEMIIDKIAVERAKFIDNAIFGEIQQIAVENGIETKIVLNEKAVLNALEKQIPKKPVIKFGEKPVTHNYGRLMQFFCPGCGRHIIAMYETDVLRGGGISNDVKGCYSCLQRIDFSGYYHKGGAKMKGADK